MIERRDDWWARLVYEDPTPATEIRADHMSKLDIATARHLWTGHGCEPVAEQVPLPRMVALHKQLHATDDWGTAHPHAAMGVQPGLRPEYRDRRFTLSRRVVGLEEQRPS
jgi:hypothetical protein